MRSSCPVHTFLALLATVMLFGSCGRMYHIAAEGSDAYRIHANRAPSSDSSAIETLIGPYRDSLEADMEEIIGHAKHELAKHAGESPLGNWVADAVLDYADRLLGRSHDVSICNSGGIRLPSIGAGPVAQGKIYELMPFDNYVVVMQLDGLTLSQFFDLMADKGGWPISRGISYVIRDGKATEVTIGGQALDPDRTYRVVLSDYIADGNGGCDFLRAHDYVNTGAYYRDAMIEQVRHLTQQGLPLTAAIEGRIKKTDQADP